MIGTYPHVLYVSPELDGSGNPEMTIEAGEDGYRLVYSGQATFLIDRSGERVIERWSGSRDSEAADDVARSVLAFVLRVRGSVPLHASAVANGGEAILFVGDSWSGKSSTAAACCTLGYALVSDDIVRLDMSGDDVVAYPSHSRVSVWGDSAAVLFGASDQDAYRKRQVDVVDAGYAFHATPARIRAVYVLAERTAAGQAPAVRDLAVREALITLVCHTHGGSFLDQEMRVRELDVIARLVERVPVRELTFSDSLDDLVSSCRTL
jgi:hypothetical protein